MPELPEVETIKRQLKPNIIGKIISDVEILSPKNFVGNKEGVIGKKIISVDRYGKVLVIKLVNNKYGKTNVTLYFDMKEINKTTAPKRDMPATMLKITITIR